MAKAPMRLEAFRYRLVILKGVPWVAWVRVRVSSTLAIVPRRTSGRDISLRFSYYSVMTSSCFLSI